MKFDFSSVKIIIWDLDDTFWIGTLSEGSVTPVETNIELVKRLTDCGIVNTICSKNDPGPVMEKLTELGISDYFIFPSIDWTPKGRRIKSLLKTIGLRPKNCLFIDDNLQNLQDVMFYNPGITAVSPDIIKDLTDYISSVPQKDLKHNRLRQYHILEEKNKAAQQFSDNTEFLFSSNIQVRIQADCQSQLDRIAELVLRSNQLNYTKRRDTKEELERLICDPDCNCGCVFVSDNFGDYGMVGFFAIKNQKCIHFLFSCRTIGQGIEEYVYARLGYPELSVIGEVVTPLTKSPAPAWINQHIDKKRIGSHKYSGKVIFKGACDLAQMSEYLDTTNIIEEFTYIGNEKKNTIEHHNHSVNYLQWHSLPQEDKNRLNDTLIFNDAEMFKTSMYDDDVSLIILSTMIEPNIGIYKNRKTGFKIAFGEASYPLTDKNNWAKYKDGTIFTAGNVFTDQWLNWFSSEYEFCGKLSPEDVLYNAKELLKKISPQAKICYILGPEIPFKQEKNPNYFGREKIYTQINSLFRKLSESDSRVLIVDVNQWVKQQRDFNNTINHFQRRVYYKMAQCINQYIADSIGYKVHKKSILYLKYRTLIDKIGRTGLFSTRFWKFIRNVKS